MPQHRFGALRALVSTLRKIKCMARKGSEMETCMAHMATRINSLLNQQATATLEQHAFASVLHLPAFSHTLSLFFSQGF